jgi:uroporphyrinogen-III synthase
MLLLTRPLEESLLMAKRMKKLDHPFFIEPMLLVTFMPPPSLEDISTLIVTSQNALKALTTINALTAIYCVGESTGTLAKKMGFKNIHVAKHSVGSLLSLLQVKTPQDLGNILYAAGETITEDLEKILKPLGYKIRTEIVYATTPATTFSPALLNLLKEEKIHQVCFFSTKTAEVFMNLMNPDHLTHLYRRMIALSLSQHISDKLRQCSWESIKTAEKPTMNSFWHLLENQVE